MMLPSLRWPAAPGHRHALATLALAVLLTLAGAVVLDTVTSVARLHTPLPFFDEWDDLGVYEALLRGTAPLSAFLWPNNEHRILFPRLVLFSDYRFFGGRGTLNLAAILAIQIADGAMMIGLLRAAAARSLGRDGLAAVIVILLFSLRQQENFIWGFQVQFVGVFALAVAGLIGFGRGLDARRRGAPALGWLLCAYLAAAAATFSMANGMLLCPVMLALAIAGRAGWRILIATATVGAALITAYAISPRAPVGGAPLAVLLQQPGQVLAFLATYLGNFLDGSVQAARVLGYCGCAVLAVAGFRALAGRDTAPSRTTLLGIMMFCAASALVTGAGRVGLGFDAALSSRYAAGSSLFGSAALIYGWSLASDPPRARAAQGAIALAAAILTLSALVAQRNAKPDMAVASIQAHQSADVLLSGLLAEEVLQNSNDVISTIASQSAFLRAQHLSVFSGRDGTLDLRPIDRAGPMADSSTCSGSVDTAEPLASSDVPGATLAGRIAAPSSRHLSDRIYIADPKGTIVGFGSVDHMSGRPLPWRGYAKASPGDTLGAYVLMADGRLCRLGEATVGDGGR